MDQNHLSLPIERRPHVKFGAGVGAFALFDSCLRPIGAVEQPRLLAETRIFGSTPQIRTAILLINDQMHGHCARVEHKTLNPNAQAPKIFVLILGASVFTARIMGYVSEAPIRFAQSDYRTLVALSALLSRAGIDASCFSLYNQLGMLSRTISEILCAGRSAPCQLSLPFWLQPTRWLVSCCWHQNCRWFPVYP
jgi:hypothetical protein